MDEAYIGDKDSNEYAHKRTKALTGKGAQGFGSKNSKTPVVDMVPDHKGHVWFPIEEDGDGSHLFACGKK